MADRADNIGKVFVGGLAPQTTDEGLKQFFSGFGEVSKANVLMSTDEMTGTRRSRGFGFVTFENPSTAEEVLSTREAIVVDGKAVEVRRNEQQGKDEMMEQRKIFVGGLPAHCDGPMLKQYFTKIDPAVIEARVVMDPMTERSRCFGYVTFSSPEFVAKALAQRDSHYMGEKWIDVKASVPQGKGKGKGKGKGYDPYGASGYGAKGYGKGGGYAASPYAPGAYDYSAYAAYAAAAQAAAAQDPGAAYAAYAAAAPAGTYMIADTSAAYAAYAAAAAPAGYAGYAAAPAAAYGATDPYAAYAAQYAAAAAPQAAAAAPAYDQAAYAAYANGGAYAGYGAGAYGAAAAAAPTAAQYAAAYPAAAPATAASPYGAAGSYRPNPY